jgi:hypothetical protein
MMAMIIGSFSAVTGAMRKIVPLSPPAVERMAAQMAAMLEQLQPSPAYAEWTAALSNTGTGRAVDMRRDTDAPIDPGMAEPLAAIAAPIVLALLVGFWLDQASKYGPDFAVANRFDLLESSDFIVGWTIGAYALAVRLLRRIRISRLRMRIRRRSRCPRDHGSDNDRTHVDGA